MVKSKRLKSIFVVGLLVCFVFAAAAKAQISTSPSGDELLEMLPAKSLFCVRVNNLDQTLSQTDQFLLGISPMPMWVSMMVRGNLAKVLGSPELNGVNMNGSFAIFGMVAESEAQGPEPPKVLGGILLPVTDYKQFIEGNTNLAPPDENGISKNTSDIFGGMLTKQIGNYALMGKADYSTFTATAKLVSAAESKGLASVLDPDEAKQAATQPLWAHGNAQLASKAFGPLLLAKIEETKKMMAEMKDSGKAPMGNPAEIMDMYADILGFLMKETKSLNMSISPKPDVVNFTTTISALPDTEMAELFTAETMTKRDNKLLNYLEDGAVMNASGQVTGELNAKAMDFFATIMTEDMNETDAAKIKSLARDVVNVFGGNDAMSFFVDPNSKPAFVVKYVIEMKDSDKDKFDELIDEAVELFNTGGIADFYKNMGMETSYAVKRDVDSYQGISIDSGRFVIKSTVPDSPQGQMINAMYGEGFDYRWAMVDGMCVCVAGGDVDSAIRELIDQVKAGGPKQMASEMKAALALIPQADKADFVGTYNIPRLFKIIGVMTTMPMPMPQMDISTKSNIAFAGNIANGKMALEVALPKEHLMEMIAMFQKMQQSQKVSELKSAANLKQLGISLAMYANDHEDKFPSSLQELGMYAPSPEAFESPRKPKDFDGPSYIYISGQTIKMNPGNILVYENPAFCSDMINVLYLDAHVEAMKPEAFLQKLEATYKRLGKEMPEIKFKESTEMH